MGFEIRIIKRLSVSKVVIKICSLVNRILPRFFFWGWLNSSSLNETFHNLMIIMLNKAIKPWQTSFFPRNRFQSFSTVVSVILSLGLAWYYEKTTMHRWYGTGNTSLQSRIYISCGLGWCKIAIAMKWYQFHTTDKCVFYAVNNRPIHQCAIHKTNR